MNNMMYNVASGQDIYMHNNEMTLAYI